MLGFGLVLLIIAIVCFVLSLTNNRGVHNNDPTPEGIIGFILIVIVSVCTIAGYIEQTCDYYNIEKERAYIKVNQDRVDTLVPLLTNELTKYPKYEKTVIESIYNGNGQLIVIPPELKTNTTVMKTVDIITKANDKIYSSRLRIENYKTSLKIHSKTYRLIAIYVPTY